MPSQPDLYLDGRFQPRDAASLGVEDRGTLFGDGVYEVLRYYNGFPFEPDAHLARLRRSLAGIRLEPPAEIDQLDAIGREVLRRNGWADAKVYWQITRGSAARELPFPQLTRPSVLVMAYPLGPLDPAAPPAPLDAILVEDVRWRHCWIKSLMLLPNMLAHNQAIQAGAQAAIFQRDGLVTEATNANAFAVREGALWTYPADGRILPGVTRQVILSLARAAGIPVQERALTVEALLAADEAFLTSTTSHLAPIVRVDRQPIGDGGPGPITLRLHQAFIEAVGTACGLT